MARPSPRSPGDDGQIDALARHVLRARGRENVLPRRRGRPPASRAGCRRVSRGSLVFETHEGERIEMLGGRQSSRAAAGLPRRRQATPREEERDGSWKRWRLCCADRRRGAGGRRLRVSSSSGAASAPGVTATSITFGTHQPLTGPAAPGYSEIAPASQAFFDYVNAHGGVFGRKIHLIIKDDAYNPANTVNVVHQLVLQDNVFGIFEGLGTPTHTKVVGFLNASKVPDLFVASGCPCWDNGARAARDVRLAAQLHDRGQDPGPVPQAALRRQEDRRPLPGRRLRQGRPGRHRGRGPRRRHRRQGALPVGHHHAGARR